MFYYLHRMDTLVGDKQPTDTVKTLENDVSNDEVWEIIDKEDDGNNMLCFKKYKHIFNAIL